MKRECPSLFAALLLSLLVNVLLRSQSAYHPRAGMAAMVLCVPGLAGVGWLFARSWRLAADPVYKLLFGVENRAILRSYIDDTLGNLTKYDTLNNTDYEYTLRVYLECSGSVQMTAERLNVHRNTVNYKMKVIREILGIEMCDEDKMNILLAFRAQEILGAHKETG